MLLERFFSRDWGTMNRVFGVKKAKTPGPTVEEATQRVSFFPLFFVSIPWYIPNINSFGSMLSSDMDFV